MEMDYWPPSYVHRRGYITWRNVLVALLIITALQLAPSAGSDTRFSDKLREILNGPSRHGMKMEELGLRALSRKPRNINVTDEDFIFGHGSDYEDDECSKVQLNYNHGYEDLYRGPVCDIIDARWDTTNLADLENCTIVNGFVQLSFMYDLTEEDLRKFRFPKLRVITHYLLIYRIFNLRSLRYMFPNLAVIGGLELFKDYALVIFDNPHLTELGLKSLQYINRGSVRIEKNSNLCYLDSVNWERLGDYADNLKLTAGDRKISKNRPLTECIGSPCGDHSNCDIDGRPLCWGYNLCQKKKCPASCNHACRGETCACHRECLAGCTRPNDPTACTACKNKYYNNTCLDSCPIDTYLIHDWLCITKNECMRIDWVFHNGQCLYSCPSGYEVEVQDCMKVCVKCDFNCGIVCPGPIEISDYHSLRQVEKCKEIEGALVISINGGSEVVKPLDDALKDLEVVGSLIIRRSFPLVSLAFLKNVRRITGVQMEQDIYSIYALDNQNLKELWDFKKSNLQIDKGKAFFHFNPQLCMGEVNKVKKLTKLDEDDKDISKLTNGDRAVCNMKSIKVLKVQKYKGDYSFVFIWWENTVVKDQRTLIGYQVLYKKSPYRNATKYEGVDACGLNSWTIVDKAKEDHVQQPIIVDNSTNSLVEKKEKPGNTSKLLSNLSPFTLYAFYIKAYTTSTATRGAESEIQYFMTKPAAPTEPVHLRATPYTTDTINVQWSPPIHPNGNITHYIVKWKVEPEEEDLTEASTKDYCTGQMSGGFTNKVTTDIPDKPDQNKDDRDNNNKQNPSGQTCKKCTCEKIDFRQKEKEAEDSAEFENYLQDKIFTFYEPNYVEETSYEHYTNFSETHEGHYDGYRRKRRDVPLHLQTTKPLTNSPISAITAAPPNTTTIPPEMAWQRKIVTSTTLNLTGLHHYSMYTIMIFACNHDSDPRSKTDLNFEIRDKLTGYTPCSIGAIIPKRTLPSVHADAIPNDSLNVSVKKVNDKTETYENAGFFWRMPTDPNGIINSFQIEINATEPRNENRKFVCVNVRPHVSPNDVVWKSLKSKELSPGTYTARVRSVSSAGFGQSWTAPVEFTFHDLRAEPLYKPIIIAISVVIIIIVILVAIFVVKTRRKPRDGGSIYTDRNPEYSPFTYIPDEYEIAVEKVSILEEIGHGNFGKVFCGLARSIVRDQDETMVAIKKLHENANQSRRLEFLKEASLMKAFNAHHVVRLLGVVSQGVVDPMVIMEYMQRGDLKSYLRSQRPGSEENKTNLPPPTLQQKLQMAAEIADGMMYLADNKFVHRDLAARNCLVHESGTVKIGDFGLTRDIYETDYYRKESRGFLPIRWMAPESLKDGIFNTQSDVWSYGVVLWELATLAEQPYQGHQHAEVTRFIIDGGYMERPRDCPSRLYEMMTNCWQYNPKMRPEFKEIVQELYGDVNEQFKECCYYGKTQENTADYDDQPAPILHPEHGFLNSEHHGNNIKMQLWPPTDTSVRYVDHPRAMGGHFSSGLSHHELDEKRGLLQPSSEANSSEHDSGSLNRDEDMRSPNTTSTTALSPPSSGEEENPQRRRPSSESSYENDYETVKPPPVLPRQVKDPNLDDSGTFVNMKSKDLDPLISYTHLNGAHKKRSRDLELDLESGVEEGAWGGTSSSTSLSNSTTPTETEAMITPKTRGKGRGKFFQILPPNQQASHC